MALHRSPALLEEPFPLGADSVACDDQEQIRPPPEASQPLTPLVFSQRRAWRLRLWLGHFPCIFAASAAAGTRSSFGKEKGKSSISAGSALSRPCCQVLCHAAPYPEKPGAPKQQQLASSELTASTALRSQQRPGPSKEPTLQKHPRSSEKHALRKTSRASGVGFKFRPVNASSVWIFHMKQLSGEDLFFWLWLGSSSTFRSLPLRYEALRLRSLERSTVRNCLEKQEVLD